MTQQTDHFAIARARAQAGGFAPPRLMQLETLIAALATRGLTADDPRVPRYFEPLFGGPQAGTGGLPPGSPGGLAASPGPAPLPVRTPESPRNLLLPTLAGLALLAFAVFAVSDRPRPETMVTMDGSAADGATVDLTDKLPPAIPDIALFLLNYRVALAILAVAALAFAWPWLQRWWEGRHRHQLRRDPLPDRSALVKVATLAGTARLFADPGLGEALRKLRRHRAAPSTRIDVRRSIRATIAHGRVPTLRFARRRLSPDYILLSERERPHDHLAAVAGAWRERLSEAKIGCEHYEFHGDPTTLRRIAETDATGRPIGAGGRERLDAVLARHEGADVVVMLESFDALAAPDAAPQWLARARQATRPHQMNPRQPRFWSRLEVQLEALGLPAFPATVAGTGQLADRIGRGIDDEAASAAPLRTPGQPDLAAFLARNRALVLSPDEPTAAQIASIVDTLERWLDQDAWDWLRALAVFPTVNGGFTFFAGCVIRDETVITHERYLMLARLPWLRAAFMPDWLRLALLRTLSPDALGRAGATAAAFLQPPADAPDRAEQLLDLRRAVEDDPAARRRLAEDLARGGNPGFNDRLLIEVLGGQPPDQLGVVLDGDLAAPPLPWWRHQGARSALAGVIGAGLLLAAQPLAWQRGAGVVQVGSEPGEPVAGPRPRPVETPDSGPMASSTPPPDSTTSPDVTQTAPDTTPTPVPVTVPTPIATSTAPPVSEIVGKTATLYVQYAVEGQQVEASLVAKQLNRVSLNGVRLSVGALEFTGANSPDEDELRCFDPSGCALAALLLPRMNANGLYPELVYFRTEDLALSRRAKPNQLELWFGWKSLPKPDPLPPTPPTPSPEIRGPFIIFFDWDSATITPEAQTILESALSAYDKIRGYHIVVSGHTDRSQSEAYSIRLSERMAAAIRDYMVKRGIPESRIEIQAFGSSRLRVETRPGVRELQNRRVEIVYERPPSAM